MKKDNEKRLMIIFGILGEVLIIWLSLLIAPTLGGGLPQMIPKLADAFAHPLALRKILCKKKSNQTLPVKRADREILLLIALFPEWERGMRASA